MTPTERLLDFAAARHVLPPQVRADATRLLGDTLAVGAAGSSAPGADGVYATAFRMGAGTEARVLGRNERLPAPGAALVNGYQIHGLEWDAVHEGAVVHAMSVVTAAMLAVCDRSGVRDPDEVIEALVVGVDIACGLGVAATSGLRFFRPATAGLIGAAFACARIDGLPREKYADLLGLAYSQCAGTMQAHVEGSRALPLQVGLAARAAVTALDMATYDLDGPHDALEGPYGYFRLFEEGTLASYATALGGTWRISEVSVKPWPCGRASHATLGAIDGLRAIDRLVAHVPPLVARLVGRPWEVNMSPAYARLCLPFLVALMLTDGRIDPRRFTPAAFADPGLRALGDRVRVVVDGNPDPNALTPQQIVIDGDAVAVANVPGSPARALGADAMDAKRALAAELARIPQDFGDPLGWLAGGAS